MSTKRYFTRDCPACPFWANQACSMTSECSTFQDLFSGGTFRSMKSVLQDADVAAGAPTNLQDAYYVDCDGYPVGKVEGDWFDIVWEIAGNVDIIGVMVPESDK